MDSCSPHPAHATSLFKLSLGSWRFSVGRTAPTPIDLTPLYDSAAWRWHASIGLLGYSRAYAKLFTRLTADHWLAGLRDGAKILDSGIGTGALGMALANSLPRRHELHGIDISPRMLARARYNLHRLRHPGLTSHLRYGDVNKLSYRDQEFDMAMCAHLLEHCLSPLHGLTEMVRVLRVGAPLLIVTCCSHRGNSLHGLRWRYRPIESERLVNWMQQAGLRDVRRYALGTGLSLPGRLSEAYVGRRAERVYAVAGGQLERGRPHPVQS